MNLTSKPPPEYQQVAWYVDQLAILAGVGWTLNYIAMAYRSLKDKTYGMALIPLCCNLSWELVYVFNQSRSGSSAVIAAMYLLTNLTVMYSALKYAHTEWSHAPLVQRNLHWLVLLGILVCVGGHRALAAQIGPGLGYYYGGMFCQLILEIGAVCQLLVRGSSRGVSYMMWFCRFVGTACRMILTSLRVTYWPQAWAWIDTPILRYHRALWLASDLFYVVCLWYIKRRERQEVTAKSKAK